MTDIRPFVIALSLSGALAATAAPADARTRDDQAAVGATPGAADVTDVRAELERLRREFEILRRQYDQRLLALEARLAALGAGPSTSPASDPAPAAPAPADAGAPEQGPPTSSQVFNPDTSVIGNFVTSVGRNPFSDEPAIALEEVEVAFQAIVDPYARADFYIGFGHEGVEIEEGFITMTSLPAHLLLKAGKLKAQFGKVNTLHTHRLPTADLPLVSENLLGGHEGFSDAGFSLSHLVQNPVLFLELTGEVFAADSPVFQSTERSRLSYLGRVRAYRDLSDATNLDLGASFAFGPTTFGADEAGHDHGAEPGDDHALDEPEVVTGLDKRLFGLDATLRYRPLRGALYRRLNLSTELVWSRVELPDGGETTAFGFYGLGEYQFARRWYLGGRVDRAARPFDGDAVDAGGAVFLTFWPTEFSQIRGQYRRINFHEGRSANEFLFQLNFSIGAHGAHVF